MSSDSSSSSKPENIPLSLVSLDSRVKSLEAQIQQLTQLVDQLKVQQLSSICRCSSRFASFSENACDCGPSCKCSSSEQTTKNCGCGGNIASAACSCTPGKCHCIDLGRKKKKGKGCECKGQNLSPKCTCGEGACKCEPSDEKEKGGGCSASGDKECACPTGKCECFTQGRVVKGASGKGGCAPSCQCASGPAQFEGCRCRSSSCKCISLTNRVCPCVATNCGCGGNDSSLNCTCAPGDCLCVEANPTLSCGCQIGSRMCRRLRMQTNHCGCLFQSRCGNNTVSSQCMRVNHGCHAHRFVHQKCLCHSSMTCGSSFHSGCGATSRSCRCVSGESVCIC